MTFQSFYRCIEDTMVNLETRPEGAVYYLRSWTAGRDQRANRGIEFDKYATELHRIKFTSLHEEGQKCIFIYLHNSHLTAQ